jgi:hypothetical protein
MSELEPLGDDLRELFAHERSSYTFDERRMDRLYRRVQATVALDARAFPASPAGASPSAAPQSPAPLAPSRGLVWKVGLGVGIGFALGLGVGELGRGRATHPETRSEVDAAVVFVVSSSPAIPSLGPSTSPVPSQAPPAVPVVSAEALPQVAPASARPSAVLAPASDLAEEQSLVDRARAALARGRAADAVAATDEHARRFPRGRLAEEREVIGIQALLASGNRSAAEARADRFRKTFPKSVFLPSLDRILGKP